MVEFGYALSSEEHTPSDLIGNAQRAEALGFSFAMISDHFHPWIDNQGHSPFVWAVIGGIAATTQRIKIGTGVTAPLIRIHPAIIAQAAATVATMLPGRFWLGVGTGEALNEHILGDHWPMIAVRQEMLMEAVEVIRYLWEGTEVNYWGEFYTVENARIYTLPEKLPPIYVAASGKSSAELAGQIGDGLISTKADQELVQAFGENGGQGKPKIGKVTFCWAPTEEEALDTLLYWWPTAQIPGTLHSDLPTPAHFEDAVKLVKKEDLKAVTHGPDPKAYLDEIQKAIDAGFDHIYLHQIGPDQEGFFTFYERELKPMLKSR